MPLRISNESGRKAAVCSAGHLHQRKRSKPRANLIHIRDLNRKAKTHPSPLECQLAVVLRRTRRRSTAAPRRAQHRQALEPAAPRQEAKVARREALLTVPAVPARAAEHLPAQREALLTAGVAPARAAEELVEVPLAVVDPSPRWRNPRERLQAERWVLELAPAGRNSERRAEKEMMAWLPQAGRRTVDEGNQQRIGGAQG